MTQEADTVIVCNPRTDCAGPNINRWYCMRGHEGAPSGVCPLRGCDLRGANRDIDPLDTGARSGRQVKP